MLTNFPIIKTAKTLLIVEIKAEFEISTSEDCDEAKEAVEYALENLQTYGAAEAKFETKSA